MADIRSLLHGLADDVGPVAAPPDLASRARRRLRRRRFAAVGTAGLAAAAIGAGALLVPHSTSTTKPAPPADGTAAELVKGHWTIGDRAAPDRTTYSRLTWTGDEVIAIGGREDDAHPVRNYAWSPSTRRWRAMADAPDSIGLGDGATTWTGSQLLVMPGFDGKAQVPEADRALLYSPAKDAWTQTAPLSHRVSANGSVAVALGHDVFVAGSGTSGLLGEIYDSAADRWTDSTPDVPEKHTPLYVEAFATPSGLLLWNFWSHTERTGPDETAGFSGIDVYRLRSGRWEDLTARWPKRLSSPYPFMAGDQLELGSAGYFCGTCAGPYVPGSPAELVDLDTLTATTLPAGPLDEGRPTRTWTGQAEIAINGEFSGGAPPLYAGEAAVRDPATGWSALPKAPTYLSGLAPVWTGHELVTQTSDGRIATFGSEAPATLPGCPSSWRSEDGTYAAGAHIDTTGVTSAKVCSYEVTNAEYRRYQHAESHEATAGQLTALLDALAATTPRPGPIKCSASLPQKAYSIFLLRGETLEAFSTQGSGCTSIVGQGHVFALDGDVVSAMDAIIG